MHTTPHLANRRPSARTNDTSRQQSSVFADYVIPEHSLLEFGCGDGAILDALDSQAKSGVESNAELAAVSTSKGYDIRPTIGSFAGTSFDRVLVSRELIDLANPKQELRSLSELLSNIGLLLISQPIDAGGRLLRPTEYRAQKDSLRTLLSAAGCTVDSISVKRYSYRTSPFKFGKGPSPHFANKKTYSMVKPFLSLVAVAHRG